jgi:hypothetical protein
VHDLIDERKEWGEKQGMDDDWLDADARNKLLQEVVLKYKPRHGDIIVTSDYRGTGTYIYNAHDVTLEDTIGDREPIGNEYYPSIPYRITKHIDRPIQFYLPFAIEPGISHIEVDTVRHKEELGALPLFAGKVGRFAYDIMTRANIDRGKYAGDDDVQLIIDLNVKEPH